jgi:hypothetical protein
VCGLRSQDMACFRLAVSTAMMAGASVASARRIRTTTPGSVSQRESRRKPHSNGMRARGTNQALCRS